MFEMQVFYRYICSLYMDALCNIVQGCDTYIIEFVWLLLLFLMSVFEQVSNIIYTDKEELKNIYLYYYACWPYVQIWMVLGGFGVGVLLRYNTTQVCAILKVSLSACKTCMNA